MLAKHTIRRGQEQVDETALGELRDYLQWLQHTRGRSRTTVALYRRILERWVVECVGVDRDLADVTTSQVERWLFRNRDGRAKGKTGLPATLSRDLSAIRGFCGYLVSRGRLRADPTLLVVTPPIRNVQPRPMPDGPWIDLWAMSKGASAIVLGLGFFGGLRREELTRLKCLNVDPVNRRLVNFVRKGGGEDVLPIGTMLDVFTKRLPHLSPERLWGYIEDVVDARRGNDFLVGWSDLGRPTDRPRTGLEHGQLHPQHLNKWLHRRCQLAQVEPFSPHQLRHSAATNLLRAGVPLAMVARLLNHANIQTTLRYARLGDDELRSWLDG